MGVVEMGPDGAVTVAAPLLDDRAAVRAAVARLSPACCAATDVTATDVTATQLKVENICGPDASVGPCKEQPPPPRPCVSVDDDDTLKAGAEVLTRL